MPHLDDTTGHGLDIHLPLLEQLGVVEDQGDQSGAMSWGVTDLASGEDGELTTDPIRSFCGESYDVESADSFAVQTGVLGETLADQGWDGAFDEFSDGPGVPVQVTTGETLVGAVEKGVVALLQHDVRYSLPLFPSGIYTGRVMSAGVKEEDGTVGS